VSVTGSHYVARVGPELTTLLLQASMCWDDRPVSPFPAHVFS
jgi:hypothetical protein